jgi:hypothetical protein
MDLDDERPSLLVRRGKGEKRRRQPIPTARRRARSPSPRARPQLVRLCVCGLHGGQLSLRRSRASSAAARLAPRSPSTSRLIRCATPRRRGCDKPQATRDSSRSTSGTQTSQPSAATRTSRPRRCTPPCKPSPTTQSPRVRAGKTHPSDTVSGSRREDLAVYEAIGVNLLRFV